MPATRADAALQLAGYLHALLATYDARTTPPAELLDRIANEYERLGEPGADDYTPPEAGS